MARLLGALRVRWAWSTVRLGDCAAGTTDSKDERAALSAQWWEANRAALPGCQAPRPPVPVLVDDDGIVVGLLSADALAPAVAPGLRLV